jgi:hypothetical protein
MGAANKKDKASDIQGLNILIWSICAIMVQQVAKLVYF